MKKRVSVSIVVPNYNNGRYLDDFILSVCNSTVVPAELIIVDDGSTDNSIDVLRKYNNGLDFLRVIQFSEHCGLPAALNRGIAIATGKYIMRADPDDLLLPMRLEIQYLFMEDHPFVDVSGANVLYFLKNSEKVINRSNFPITHSQIAHSYRHGEHGVLHPTVIAKSKVFKGYRYQPVFPGEDYEIFARMIGDGVMFESIADAVNLMRIHPGSSTCNLKFISIRQTFQFRDRLFGTTTSRLHVYRYFYHIKFYRLYQTSDNFFVKYVCLFCTAFLMPSKIKHRLFGFLRKT